MKNDTRWNDLNIVRKARLPHRRAPLPYLVLCVVPLLSVATPCAAEERSDPRAIVVHGLDAWKRQDWDGLYALLSGPDRKAILMAAFVALYALGILTVLFLR